MAKIDYCLTFRSGLSVTGVLLLSIASCTVGPNYKRPEVPVPEAHRADPAPEQSKAAMSGFGSVEWFDLFQDEQLRQLIRTALEKNYDIQIAVQRIIEANERYGISRADLFPSVDLTTGVATSRTSTSGTLLPPGYEIRREVGSVGVQAVWELDFWGRIRRANEAARAELLATEEARNAVYQSLVTGVAQAYFELRELDLELEIARRTVKSREESLRLVILREQMGVSSIMDVRQSESLVASAKTRIPLLEKGIETKENEINLLLAQNPGPVTRGKPLTEQKIAPEVPAGLPSDLLARRPDIRYAEALLVAENARIGQARALLFPQIALSGELGTQSNALTNLFTNPATYWTGVAGLVQPIFNSGKLKRNVRAQEARQQQALLEYQKAVQQAFREVADSLTAYTKAREFRAEQEKLTAVLQDAARVSQLRYSGGVTSYLEVLDTERQLFDAELGLAQAQRNELLAVIQLYKVLGGGWET